LRHAAVAVPAEREHPEPAVRGARAIDPDPPRAPPPGRTRDPLAGSARARDLLDRRPGRLPRRERRHRLPCHRAWHGVDHAAAGRPDAQTPARTIGTGTGMTERGKAPGGSTFP